MSEIFVTIKGRITAPQPGVAFMDLRFNQCRWPLGGPTDPPTRFCRAPTQPGAPYCPECQKIVYAAMARR